MEELKSLVTEMNQIWPQMKKEIEKNNEAGKKTSESLEKMQSRMNEIDQKIQSFEAKANRPEVQMESQEKIDEKKSILRKTCFLKSLAGKSLTQEESEFMSTESKIFNLTDENSGGFRAPSEFSAEVLADVVQISPIRQFARVRPISGREFMRPKRTQSTTPARRRKETALVTATDLKYDLLKFQAFPLDALSVVSRDSLEDIAGLESDIRADFAQEIGQIEGNDFVNGTGSNEPTGFLVDSRVTGVTSSVTAKIDFKDMIRLKYSLKSEYHARGRWFMNQSIVGHFRQLTNNDGNFLWAPPLEAGAPPTIDGNPYTMVPDMPSTVETGAKVIAFADMFQGYLIVDRNMMTVEVIREKYLPNIGFYATVRNGGGVMLPEAIKILTVK